MVDQERLDLWSENRKKRLIPIIAKLIICNPPGGATQDHLARHFSAIQNGNRRSEYEQQEIYGRIQPGAFFKLRISREPT